MTQTRPVAIAIRGVELIVLMLAATPTLLAGDWPQILGPHRNGIAEKETLAEAWPDSGPATFWEAKIGSGFAGVAVSKNVVVLFHRIDDNDVLTAFDEATGQKSWDRTFPTKFIPQIVEDDGPRAVPTIHNGFVYALAPAGGLYCVDIKSGKPVWERQTQREFQAPAGYFGAGSSPLVEGKTLIVNVGGDKQGAGVVAFDLETGKTVWKSVADQASYSSPVAVTVDGIRHLLCVTRLNFVSLNPSTGEEKFRLPFGQRGPTVNAAIPVVLKNQILLTASYGIGAELVSISGDQAESTWKDEVLSSQYTTPVLHEGIIYGVDGRQDGGAVVLKCFDPATRKVHWTKTLDAYATLIGADGKLIVMQTNGKSKLVALSTKSYQELASASVLPGVTRALPALAAGRLYVRNEKRLKCVMIGR